MQLLKGGVTRALRARWRTGGKRIRTREPQRDDLTGAHPARVPVAWHDGHGEDARR